MERRNFEKRFFVTCIAVDSKENRYLDQKKKKYIELEETRFQKRFSNSM